MLFGFTIVVYIIYMLQREGCLAKNIQINIAHALGLSTTNNI